MRRPLSGSDLTCSKLPHQSHIVLHASGVAWGHRLSLVRMFPCQCVRSLPQLEFFVQTVFQNPFVKCNPAVGAATAPGFLA